MEKQKLSGYIMVGVGFAMLLVNAVTISVSSIFNWDIKSQASTVLILGLAFVVIGLGISRKPSK